MSYNQQNHNDASRGSRHRRDVPLWVLIDESEMIRKEVNNPDRGVGEGTTVNQLPCPMESERLITTPPLIKKSNNANSCSVDGKNDARNVDSFIENNLVRNSKNEVNINNIGEVLHNPNIIVETLSSTSSNTGSESSPLEVVEVRPKASFPEGRNMRFPADGPSTLKEKKPLSYSRCWILGLTVGIVIFIIPVATVCGIGKCQASSTSSPADSTDNGNSTNMNNIASGSPTSVPVMQTLRPTRTPATKAPSPLMPTILQPPVDTECSDGQIAFSSTSELYSAVDDYIELTEKLGSGSSESVYKNYRVTRCYGYPMNAWDVSRISDFSRLFDPNRELPYERNRNTMIYRNVSHFNEDLNDWDTSSAVTMFGMFAYATAFNGNLSGWNLSSVTNTSDMFYHAKLFAGTNDVSLWDVSRVQSMAYMFASAQNFIGNLSSWNISSVVDLRSTFESANFFQSDLSQWDTSNVVDMSGTFKLAYIFNSELSDWDVSKVENMFEMFESAFLFNDNISLWDVSRGTSMAYMFFAATTFNSDVSLWNVGNVVDMRSMFGATRDFSGDLSQWDVGKVVNMTGLFAESLSFQSDLSPWNVSRVQSMDYMFFGTPQFNSNLSSWDVRNVENMNKMFQNADLFNQDISMWKISNVQSMQFMFYNATSFNQDLCEWGRIIQAPDLDVRKMFTDSGCKEPGDPIVFAESDRTSSWCQACTI